MENNNDDDMVNDPSNESTLIDSQELDEADLEAIKGDTIGDTVYSAKWIINTLIALSKVYEDGWSESLESSLCILWDMTTEKDVVIFLMDNDFLKIAEFTLKVSKEPRLTEIIVGIVGNMCCQPAVLEKVAEMSNLVSMIFELLTTDDSETLIQVIRLLQAFVWDIQKNTDTKWLQHLIDCQFLDDALTFILKSSMNGVLLIATVDLLQSILDLGKTNNKHSLLNLFKFEQLLPALLESFFQLMPMQDRIHSHTDLKFIEKWLTILSNIMQSEFCSLMSDIKDENFTKIMDAVSRILQPYKDPNNLMPLDEHVALCIHGCVEIVHLLQRNQMHPNPKIIHVIVMIICGCRAAIINDCTQNCITDPDDNVKELLKYLGRYWIETLIAYKETDLLEIIEICQTEQIKHLLEVTSEYSKESTNLVEKLKRVQCLNQPS